MNNLKDKAKGVLHTLRFMWLGRFCGSIEGGEYDLLWTIRIYKSAVIKLDNLTLNKLHSNKLFLIDHGEFNVDIKNTKWVTR